MMMTRVSWRMRLASAAKACLELFLHLLGLTVLDLSHPIPHLGSPLRRAQRVLQHPLHSRLLDPVEGCGEFGQGGRRDHPANRAAAQAQVKKRQYASTGDVDGPIV